MMHKKLILGLVTFAMAVAAYWVLSSADNYDPQSRGIGSTEAVRNFVTMPTTQSSRSVNEAGVTLSGGERTLARVYDDVTGRLKYQFEARTWEPVSEADFLLQDVLIQIFSPKGEITYISADRAQMTLARKAKNRFEPKRGWLRQNVKVVIDRTSAAWREANPELAARDAHPDELIHIDLQEATFDLDQAELHSDGPIVINSREAQMEDLEGLRLQWDQVDNRIDVLAFKRGGRMLLRRGGKIVDFGMPGAERDANRSDDAGGDVAEVPVDEAARFVAPRAQAMIPMTIDAVTAEEAAAEVRTEAGVVVANRPKSLSAPPSSNGGNGSAGPVPGETGGLRSPEALAADMEALQAEARAAKSPGAATQPTGDAVAKNLTGKRVHTYSAVFHHRVVVEQLDGGEIIGKLEADTLELNFDFGQKLKDLTRSSVGARPAEATTQPSDRPARLMPPSPTPFVAEETQLVLTWNGPLELRPLRVDPAEQTGQRFDAVATGRPVRVQSVQGTARCDQLVYRHERGQVWLSGSEEAPVQMAVNETRRLVGREVFFDQRRGLARVDGPGYMLDERRPESPAAPDEALGLKGAPEVGEGLAALTGKLGSDQKDRRVEIRWSRGVDIELGKRMVQRMNPTTGLMENKRKEFLQRAWFHGDAFVKQGEAEVTAQEVAATFGPPVSGEELADHIQHLNLSGAVKLTRDDDLISAERLDVEMTVTPQGRNVPRVVDGDGQVLIRQGQSEFRADRMHAVLQPKPPDQRKSEGDGASSFGSSDMGIETLEAYGKVFVADPEHNLKIRQAESLNCSMHVGNRLSKVLIVGQGADSYARLRYGELAIHGHRIEIDMDAEAVDVPGPGKTWMVSHRDFSGRKLKRPAPVKTTWTEKMQFRLAKNYGVFIGQVRSETQGFTLNSDKLTVRFGKVAPVREEQDGKQVDRFWLLGAITGDKAEVKPLEATMPGQERSRPVAIVAEGNAEALSSSFAPTATDGTPGRLLNRLRIAGDRIVADLLREQMSVPGAGSLLIEDYQIETKRSGVNLTAAGPRPDPLMSTMRDEGPSQTLVTWANAMDFFVDRNLVAFDKNVVMVHRSGQQMVLQDELAAALRVDTNAMKQLREGRKASLDCGYLLLEFMSGGSDKGQAGTAPMVRATDLQRLIAKHAVHLQEGTKSLMGAHLQYLHDTNEVRLEGTQNLEARIIDQEESSQRFNMWRGPLLIWNRQTNRVEAPGATIRASRD